MMCKLLQNKYIFIAFILFFFAVSLIIKKDEINKNIGAPNIEAPYHVLHTVNGYMKNNISQHYFLPILTLDKEFDKFISWGATVPDGHGNYFYTSFTSTTFVLPYVYFKLTGADLTIQNLVKFNYLLQLISIILIFLLLRKINIKVSQNQVLSNSASFFASIIILIFSTEFMISFGLGYWAHSISQILIISQLYLLISISQDGFSNKKLILLGLVSIFFCYTEWTGFSTTGLISLFFLYSFITNKNKENLKIFITLIFSIIIGGLLIVTHFGLVIGPDNLFNALYSRFTSRSTNKIDYMLLLIGYVKSYGLYLFILPILSFILIKKTNESLKIDYRLFYLPIFYSLALLVENIIMMQHAVEFSFDRLKFSILLVFLYNVFFLQFFISKRNIYITLIIFGIILLSVIQNIDTYKNTLRQYYYFETLHTKNLEFKQFIADIAEEKNILCSNIGVRAYENFLFDRSIYERILNLEECVKLAQKRGAEKVYFLNANMVFTDIPELLNAEIYDLKNNVKSNVKAPTYLMPYALTDGYSLNGIWRTTTGFFVLSNLENSEIFLLGNKVQFSDGTIRSIIHTSVTNPYLNIFLDGAPLNGEKVGYPNKIKIVGIK